ncbi:hypothetical protein RSOLAG1IB_01212 [Rhizoctonia solani AG-1 IB]|uniref:PX domain-containing protein n=2 Tax=Thanatephorus cucumeris (strain AG1-IB / isolate 7/3/14) TaxID=1108050 RepID=A0A0B7FE77_THACB|nr:hypothetical protein RSOLAG1IB_01212 [Rhizoctonia solani AG-1 IB]
MSFTHMGAGLANTDSSSSQMYRRGILIHCPPEFSVDIVPPMKEGSSWHYGLRVKPLPSLSMSPPGGPLADPRQKRVKGYEIHRKWEDCLDLQRVLEKEYSAIVKARKSKGGKKGPSVYGNPQRAASFDSLPTGPDPKTIPNDIHGFIPRLAAKSSLFRGASGSALVQQRSEEFNEFISALFAPGASILIDETRQTPAVREWFGFWRRDRDAMRRRDSERASIAPSIRRLSIAASDAPPLPTNVQERSASPYTSSPLAQTSYESTPIALDIQEQPRPSYETTYGDLATALDTFPMPPTPQDGPAVLEPSPKSIQPHNGFVPIVQRRLGLVRNDAARGSSFRNAQFFSAPTSPLPSVPGSVAPSDHEYESDAQRFETMRGPRAISRSITARTEEDRPKLARPRRATSPSMSSGSISIIHPTPPSASPRSSQTSDWSMGLSSNVIQALSRSETSEEQVTADDQSEIEKMRKMSLSSLSSSSSRRLPPPIPPRSILRRPSPSHMRNQSDATAIVKPSASRETPAPAVVYDEEDPEFEIVTHTVLNSYLEDARLSLLSSECAISSNSGSSIRRSMTPSIASAYSTSSAGGRDSISGHGIPPPAGPSPTTPLPPVPSTPTTALIPPNEIVLKAVCPIGDSIVLCRVSRTAPLSSVREMLASKFRQAAGVQLDLLEHGFVLGYLNQRQQQQLLRPGTAGGRPGTAGNGAPLPPPRSNGRPGTAPSGGRTRSSSLSSVAACADPIHLSLIVTQRDWENAVAKHGEKMTVRVLLAGTD